VLQVAQIKSASEIAKKWSEVTPTRQAYYESGVKNPLKDWATNTAQAEDAWAAGVQEAAANKRFGAGVRKAGTEKWSRKVVEVGVPRWGAGVRAASPDFENGFKPYRDVIESTALPPKYAKGDPRNIDRVAAISQALHKKKVSG